MFGRGRTEAGNDDARQVEPWVDGELRATWSPMSMRLGRRTVPGVELHADGASQQFRVDEVLDVLDGQTAVAESASSPTAFFCSRSGAPGSSIAGESLAALAPDAVAVLVTPMDAPPSFVLDGDARQAFREWLVSAAG